MLPAVGLDRGNCCAFPTDKRRSMLPARRLLQLAIPATKCTAETADVKGLLVSARILSNGSKSKTDVEIHGLFT
jgi:hypothetical protein